MSILVSFGTKLKKTCLLFSNFALSMILLLDFGNTRVKAAVLEDGTLRQVYCGPVLIQQLSDAVAGMDIHGGMWCSVHELEWGITEWMTGLGLTPLSYDTSLPISSSYSTPKSLGMDRMAAAVGAWSMYPGHDLLVIDAGTAITCDFVSRDGVYRGGNISPGVQLRFSALHEHTGALPLVDRHGDVPLLGYNTETAIRSGVLNGISHELIGYIDDLAAVYPSLLVFLTGGDAEFFDIKAKSSIFAVPDLVLRGLARIVEYNERGI